MKLRFMRWMDFWVGVPVCFLLSLVAGLQRLLGLRTAAPEETPQRVLFIELSEMGSTVLAYSAMRKAREFIGAELYFLIFKENEESIGLLDLIPPDQVITIRSRSLSSFVMDTCAAILKARSCKIDTVVDLELFSRFSSILCFFSGARKVVGFYRYHLEGLYRGTFQTHRVMYNPYYHMSRNFLALVQALAGGPGDEPLLKQELCEDEVVRARVVSSEDERDRIRQKLCRQSPAYQPDQKVVIINAGAGKFLSVRKWPLDCFVALVKALLDLPDVVVVLIGVAEDQESARAICEASASDRCIDFTGRTEDLKELVDLYNISDVLVTNDSGPAHFASLTDIRVFTLFGPETPVLYAPLGEHSTPLYANLACSPCVSAFNHRKTTCTDNQCLKRIPPEQVIDLVKESLQSLRHSDRGSDASR